MSYNPMNPYGQRPGMQVPNSPMMGARPPGPPQGQPQQLQQGQMPGMPPRAPMPPQAGEDNSQRVLEEALLGTYGDVMERDLLKEQMAQAQALRDVPAPEMRGNGRVQTAANPLEFIGRGIQQYRQGKEVRDLREGVRNPGYAPGVTSTPQPEWKREGIRGIGKRIGENVKKYGLNLPE